MNVFVVIVPNHNHSRQKCATAAKRVNSASSYTPLFLMSYAAWSLTAAEMEVQVPNVRPCRAVNTAFGYSWAALLEGSLPEA